MTAEREALRQCRDALYAWNRLIDFQFTGSRAAMDLMTRADETGQAAIAAADAVLAQPDKDYPCRTDGRCQYAIDHGAEGLGHCPRGKCAMPDALAQPAPEPVTFEQAWAGMEALGYQYGHDALEQVRLGWELRGAPIITPPKPEPKPEPVAWANGKVWDGQLETDSEPHDGWYPLYTHPAPTVTLPPLPQPFFRCAQRFGFLSADGYSSDQMRNYAIKCLRAAGAEVRDE